jgi:hypothetical protein
MVNEDIIIIMSNILLTMFYDYFLALVDNNIIYHNIVEIGLKYLLTCKNIDVSYKYDTNTINRYKNNSDFIGKNIFSINQ